MEQSLTVSDLVNSGLPIKYIKGVIVPKGLEANWATPIAAAIVGPVSSDFSDNELTIAISIDGPNGGHQKLYIKDTTKSIFDKRNCRVSTNMYAIDGRDIHSWIDKIRNVSAKYTGTPLEYIHITELRKLEVIIEI